MILFKWHAGLMTAAFLSFFSALLVAATQRRKPWWLRCHRAAGILGTLFILFGMTAAIAAVAAAAEGHLRSPHTWIGALTIAVALATPILGLLQFKIQEQAGRRLSQIHRLSGRILTSSALVAVLFGLRVAGLL
ncbi:MAG: hypothetical protein ACOYOS_07725 [Syntrophales bacterium]